MTIPLSCPYYSRIRLTDNQPINPASVDPSTMPVLADSTEGPVSKAGPAMNSDMMNPIPASTPTASS